MHGTILWQRFEGAAVFACAIALFIHTGSPIVWWAAIVIFFAPDLSFSGYLLGPRLGAIIYNSVHVYAFGIALLAIGLLLANPLLAGLGALWLGHAGFDRLMGYGLKSSTGFTETHLGRIGRKK